MTKVVLSRGTLSTKRFHVNKYRKYTGVKNVNMQPQPKSDWFKFSSIKMIGGIQILQVHIKVGSGHFRQTSDTFAACTKLILLIFFTDEDMTPIQDIAGLNFVFTPLGVTVGLPCYLIFEKSSNLVVQQRRNQPVEQVAVEATRIRNGIQRIRRKQPTEHDERLGRTGWTYAMFFNCPKKQQLGCGAEEKSAS